MICNCRKLYAHKGSILLNSRSDHGKPREFFSSGLLWRGSCMLFLWPPVLYRAGAGWYRSAKTKRRFAARAQTLNAHCFVRFASFAAFRKKVTVYRAADQQPQCQAERARCAGYGLVTKFSSKITNSSKKKKKKKKQNKSQCQHCPPMKRELERAGDDVCSSSDVNHGVRSQRCARF